ncbi:MAG: hypothetical protein J6X28_05625 [Bacilli bacterium]|nr:hypothetical protein [Bacilli bacterium]
MKFLKKHRSLTLILLILIALVIAYFILKDTVNFDESTAVYGNRLEGIEAVEITKDQKKSVEDALKEKSTSVTVRVAGKLVNVIVQTKGEVTLEEAKAMGPAVLELFTPEQKAFYDFQFLIDNSENQSQFPIIGYMQHSRDAINWTKDREKVEG